MKLYYSAGSCSLSPHIAMREAGIEPELVAVNLKTKEFEGGKFMALNPKGYVPAIEIEGSELLTEGAVICQYIANKKPEKKLMPTFGTNDYFRCQEWLNFIATEVHKGFSPLWNPMTSDEGKEMAKDNLFRRFDFIETSLKGKDYLMGKSFTVADGYLFTVLNWTNMLKLDLAKWPTMTQYMTRVFGRPAVQAAMKAEGLLK